MEYWFLKPLDTPRTKRCLIWIWFIPVNTAILNPVLQKNNFVAKYPIFWTPDFSYQFSFSFKV